MYVTASGPADKDYVYSKDVCFINPISENNPDDGSESSYSCTVTLKKGEISAKGIAYKQPIIPKKVWVSDY